MRVLIISLDRSLLTADKNSDVLTRHQEYAQKAGRLEIIVFSPRGYVKRKIDQHLAIYPTNSSKKINYVLDAYDLAKNIFWPDKFDLIVCQDPFLTGLAGWLIKRYFSLPLLIHFHGDFWQNKFWLWERWYNFPLLILSKFLVSQADGIRVVSSGIKAKLIQTGISRRKIRVIPTPVDIGKFVFCAAEKVRKIRGEHQSKKTIINVGLRDPRAKDYPTLFKAVNLVYEKYRNLCFWQIGANLNLAEKIKGEKSLILISQGQVSQEDLVNYYHASDVYVSSSKHESFGKVLVEAMAAGLPVVATKTTGSQEIVQDGVNGYLVPIGNSQALAQKILFLFNNPQKAKAMGQKGREMAKEGFNREQAIKKMIKFWEDLCGF